ncbi:MAG: methyl-accepting chemotaxis protein [Alphaproteobacteria bacterium]
MNNDSLENASEQTPEINEDTKAKSENPGRSLSVGAKIYAVTALTLAMLIVVAGTGIWQMQKIGHEIEGIAERDIPLTEIVTKITVHQLEQAVNYERAFGAGVLMRENESSKDHYENSVLHFMELSKKVDNEIKEGEKLAKHDIATAASKAEADEYKHVLYVLESVEKEHHDYEVHATEVLNLVKAGNIPEALKLHAKVEAEEEGLDKKLETLLTEIEKFTAGAALTAEEHEKFAIMLMLGVSLAALLISVVLSWLIVSRSIALPLREVITGLKALTSGDMTVEVTPRNRDEIGEVAVALEHFRNTTIEARRLEEEATLKEREAMEERAKNAQLKAEADRAESEKQAEQAARAKKRAEGMAEIIESFQATVGDVLEVFGSASSQLDSASQSLSETAEKTSTQSASVASASSQASANVQTVASATEELSSSVQEISRQVTESSRIAREAVSDAETANAKVQGLAEASNKIGEVVELINDIASQTNLLALNATIEAARTGEAGKGFAVVATEVKSLADQTAKATEEIGGQIAAIQAATGDAVEAIDTIGKTINTVEEISSSIAAAVEEQGTATNEIAVNVQQAATGTREVDASIEVVSHAAEETGSAASQVMSAGKQLKDKAEDLKTSVDKFLTDIRNVAA